MKVFICYRRKDSQHISGRIYDRLECKFGPKNVFKDVDSIPVGRNFRPVLEDAVTQCDVLLAVIGPRWLAETDAEGRRRVDDPKDWVRIEIGKALERDILTIPLLVDEAPLPRREALPLCLQGLVDRQGMPVRPDPDFRCDMERLIEAIQSETAEKEEEEIGEAPLPPSETEDEEDELEDDELEDEEDEDEEDEDEEDEDEDDPEAGRLGEEEIETVRKILGLRHSTWLDSSWAAKLLGK